MHQRKTTTIGLGLFAAWALDDLEELHTMRETSRTVASRMPAWARIPADVRRDGLSQRHMNRAIALTETGRLVSGNHISLTWCGHTASQSGRGAWSRRPTVNTQDPISALALAPKR